MQKRFLIAAVAAALSLPLALTAADEKKKGGNPFAAADKNGDGKLSKAEFVAAMSERAGSKEKAESRFAQLDKDGDGSLTREEFNMGMQKKGGEEKKGGGKKKKSDAN